MAQSTLWGFVMFPDHVNGGIDTNSIIIGVEIAKLREFSMFGPMAATIMDAIKHLLMVSEYLAWLYHVP